MSQSDQKTEKPTPRRLRKAREEGQFLVSKELAYAAQFSAVVVTFMLAGQTLCDALLAGFRSALLSAQSASLTSGYIVDAVRYSLPTVLFPLIAAGVLVSVSGLCAQFAMTQFGLAPQKLAPDVNRLLPFNRLKNLPQQNMHAALEAVVALPVLAGLLWIVVSDSAASILLLPLGSLEGATLHIARLVMKLGRYGMLFLLVWGALDLVRQMRRRMKDLRMTKQEIRDEWKQNEGNPEIKSRIRRLRRDLLRRRMMADVKTATAIIVNPTHYSVAIRYDMQSMSAPRVVGKGKNYLALRIREIAQQNMIPIVENQPLARALYADCEVGQDIPVQLYRAVAEVLAYIFRITGAKQHG